MPGVGADYAIELLKSSGMLDINKNVPLDKTNIRCLRWDANFFENSEEGNNNGLGWIKGNVRKLVSSNKNTIKLPHMGEFPRKYEL